MKASSAGNPPTPKAKHANSPTPKQEENKTKQNRNRNRNHNATKTAVGSPLRLRPLAAVFSTLPPARSPGPVRLMCFVVEVVIEKMMLSVFEEERRKKGKRRTVVGIYASLAPRGGWFTVNRK